jgi:hypothetical protein
VFSFHSIERNLPILRGFDKVLREDGRRSMRKNPYREHICSEAERLRSLHAEEVAENTCLRQELRLYKTFVRWVVTFVIGGGGYACLWNHALEGAGGQEGGNAFLPEPGSEPSPWEPPEETPMSILLPESKDPAREMLAYEFHPCRTTIIWPQGNEWHHLVFGPLVVPAFCTADF